MTTSEEIRKEVKAVQTTTEEIRKEDSLLDHMEIVIVETEKRFNIVFYRKEFYTVYLIKTKVIDPDFRGALTQQSSLWRRYTEFEILRNHLEVSYPYIVIPPLPERKHLYGWQKAGIDKFNPDFVDRRRAGLEKFLLRVASHPVLSHDEHFMGFLQQDDEWQRGIKETSNAKLRALSLVVRPKKPDRRFETIKDYGIELQNNLCKLLRVRARSARKQYRLYKLHAKYGRVFSEWSAIEKEMGDGLQKSGHYLDSIAASIDTALEEEELIADQLKEWLFGAKALVALVSRREALQLDRDEAHDALVATRKDRDAVQQQGKTDFVSRVFVFVDTEEFREWKVHQLEQRNNQSEIAVKQADEDLESFSIKAMVDIERFQHQKVIDLKETLAAYCVLQFKLARKNLQTWQHIKDCLESIP